MNLSEHRVIPFERKGPYPAQVWGEAFVCDETDPPNLDELKARGQALFVVVGFEKALVDATGWGNG